MYDLFTFNVKKIDFTFLQLQKNSLLTAVNYISHINVANYLTCIAGMITTHATFHLSFYAGTTILQWSSLLRYTARAAVHVVSLFTENNNINLGISSHPITVQTDKQYSPRNVSHACKMYTIIAIQILQLAASIETKHPLKGRQPEPLQPARRSSHTTDSNLIKTIMQRPSKWIQACNLVKLLGF